jgi:hypothetical protein
MLVPIVMFESQCSNVTELRLKAPNLSEKFEMKMCRMRASLTRENNVQIQNIV